MEENNVLLTLWASTEMQKKLAGTVRKDKIYREPRTGLEMAGFRRTTEQIVNKLKKVKKGL